MRLIPVFVGACAIGAVAGKLTMADVVSFAPQTKDTFAAMKALGGDPTKFEIDQIDLQKAFDQVAAAIHQPLSLASLGFPQTTPLTLSSPLTSSSPYGFPAATLPPAPSRGVRVVAGSTAKIIDATAPAQSSQGGVVVIRGGAAR